MKKPLLPILRPGGLRGAGWTINTGIASALAATARTSLAAVATTVTAVMTAMAAMSVAPVYAAQVYAAQAGSSAGAVATAAQTPVAEIPTAETPAQKNARARAFLARYIGTWEGNSTVYLLQGGHSQTLSAHVTYRRDRKNAEIISGQAVFAAGEQMVHATSRFYIHDGDIFCEVEFQGKKELYSGHLAADGNSITWSKSGTTQMLGASSKDIFTVHPDGKIELVFEGFENLNNQKTTLTQRTRLIRTNP